MKKFWYSIKTMVYAYTVQYLTLIFAILAYIYVTNDEEILLSPKLYTYIIIGITITIIPLTIYLYKKNYQKESKINYQKLLSMIPLGIGISLFYNMLTINLKQSVPLMDLSLPVLIIYTAIIGPIYEEIVFRYVSLTKAKEMYTNKTAIILITTIFALMHSGIINIIYAFIIGLILALIYQKYKNIIYPIIIHISANFTSIFIKGYNTYLLIISIILLIVSIYLIKKQNSTLKIK